MAALYVRQDGSVSEGWHRACIRQIHDVNTVSVFYVDYGTTAEISLDHCRFLHRKFSKLPLQAIKCRMAGVWPFMKNKSN